MSETAWEPTAQNPKPTFPNVGSPQTYRFEDTRYGPSSIVVPPGGHLEVREVDGHVQIRGVDEHGLPMSKSEEGLILKKGVSVETVKSALKQPPNSQGEIDANNDNLRKEAEHLKDPSFKRTDWATAPTPAANDGRALSFNLGTPEHPNYNGGVESGKHVETRQVGDHVEIRTVDRYGKEGTEIALPAGVTLETVNAVLADPTAKGEFDFSAAHLKEVQAKLARPAPEAPAQASPPKAEPAAAPATPETSAAPPATPAKPAEPPKGLGEWQESRGTTYNHDRGRKIEVSIRTSDGKPPQVNVFIGKEGTPLDLGKMPPDIKTVDQAKEYAAKVHKAIADEVDANYGGKSPKIGLEDHAEIEKFEKAVKERLAKIPATAPETEKPKEPAAPTAASSPDSVSWTEGPTAMRRVDEKHGLEVIITHRDGKAREVVIQDAHGGEFTVGEMPAGIKTIDQAKDYAEKLHKAAADELEKNYQGKKAKDLTGAERSKFEAAVKERIAKIPATAPEHEKPKEPQAKQTMVPQQQQQHQQRHQATAQQREEQDRQRAEQRRRQDEARKLGQTAPTATQPQQQPQRQSTVPPGTATPTGTAPAATASPPPQPPQGTATTTETAPAAPPEQPTASPPQGNNGTTPPSQGTATPTGTAPAAPASPPQPPQGPTGPAVPPPEGNIGTPQPSEIATKPATTPAAQPQQPAAPPPQGNNGNPLATPTQTGPVASASPPQTNNGNNPPAQSTAIPPVAPTETAPSAPPPQNGTPTETAPVATQPQQPPQSTPATTPETPSAGGHTAEEHPGGRAPAAAPHPEGAGGHGHGGIKGGAIGALTVAAVTIVTALLQGTSPAEAAETGFKEALEGLVPGASNGFKDVFDKNKSPAERLYAFAHAFASLAPVVDSVLGVGNAGLNGGAKAAWQEAVSSIGALVGGALGFAVGGPIGAAIGSMIGAKGQDIISSMMTQGGEQTKEQKALHDFYDGLPAKTDDSMSDSMRKLVEAKATMVKAEAELAKAQSNPMGGTNPGVARKELEAAEKKFADTFDRVKKDGTLDVVKDWMNLNHPELAKPGTTPAAAASKAPDPNNFDKRKAAIDNQKPRASLRNNPDQRSPATAQPATADKVADNKNKPPTTKVASDNNPPPRQRQQMANGLG